MTRLGFPKAFGWYFVFLVVLIPVVVYGLLLANGTSADLAGAIVKLYLVFMVGAISLYSWLKLYGRLDLS